jgi:hypothetical protein
MDFSRLKTNDWLMGGGALVLFISSFLPWFGVGNSYYSVTWSGWSSGFFAWFGILLGMAVLAYVIVFKLLDVDMPELPLPEPLLVLIVSGVSTVCVLLRLLFGASVLSYGLGRKYGLFLATIAAIVMTVGAGLNFKEEGSPTSNTGGGSTPPPGGTPPTPF